MKNGLVTARSISELLNQRVGEVAAMLVPAGKEDGGKWVFGDAGGGAGSSVSVNLNGGHPGKWRDWASESDRGDLLDLWASTRSITLSAAIQEAKKWLGIINPTPTKRKSYPSPPTKPAKPLSPQGCALNWFKDERSIVSDVVSAFRIEGDEQRRIVFPSYSPEGVLINRSYRPLDSKDFQQEKGCAPSLFGWQAIQNKAARKIVICEGQIDAMTWHQWGIDALSVPNGAKNLNWIEYEWDNLEMFDTIYLSMDMDEQGREASEKICERLGIDRCLEVTLPYKDANDCLRSSCGPADAAKWIAEAKARSMADLLIAANMAGELASVYYPSKDQDRLVFSSRLLAGKYGKVSFRPGEVTAWTGYAGHGKTTLIAFLALEDIALRESVYFFASMEMLPKKILHKMATATIGTAPSLEKINEFAETVGTKMLFANVLGYITEDKLFQMMLYCVRRYGMTSAVIDSFMAVSELEEDYPRQGMFLSKLNAFAKEHNVHVHLVCHPRKGDEKAALNMMDVKGGSVIINRADVILVVQRNMEKAKMIEDGKPLSEMSDMPDTVVLCRKDRETGWRGKMELFFNWNTNTFSRFAPSVSKPQFNGAEFNATNDP